MNFVRIHHSSDIRSFLQLTPRMDVISRSFQDTKSLSGTNNTLRRSTATADHSRPQHLMAGKSSKGAAENQVQSFSEDSTFCRAAK